MNEPKSIVLLVWLQRLTDTSPSIYLTVCFVSECERVFGSVRVRDRSERVKIKEFSFSVFLLDLSLFFCVFWCDLNSFPT